MKRNAIFSALLVAACGGGNKNAVTTTDLGPSGSPAVESVEAATRPTDPKLAFRSQFSNPGGMWMPSQMSLPQHGEIFEKMGVRSSAEALANPLAYPRASIVSLGGCTASFVSPDGLI